MFRGLVVGLVALLLPDLAFAHALGVEVKIKEQSLWIEAFYDDDTPAEEAKLTVYNAAQEVVAQGMTNERGVWTGPMPAAGEYSVRVDDGAGHTTKVSFTIPESQTAQPISDGPSREQFTTPWVRLGLSALGVLIIAGGFFLYKRFRQPK